MIESEAGKISSAKTAGILSIIAGAIIVVSAIFGFFFLKILIDAFSSHFSPSEGIPWFIVALLVIPMAVIGVVAILGGREAVRHQRWGLALAGAICSILGFCVLGVPALILLVSSRRAFTK
jgi:hypothetical protein